jgi:hypothetical protein
MDSRYVSGGDTLFQKKKKNIYSIFELVLHRLAVIAIKKKFSHLGSKLEHCLSLSSKIHERTDSHSISGDTLFKKNKHLFYF